MALGNPGRGARRANISSPVTRHSPLLAINYQLSTFSHLLASSESVGGAGGGLGFCFCGEFFPARPIAPHGGKIRATVAGGDRGIEKTAADVCGTGRLIRIAGH